MQNRQQNLKLVCRFGKRVFLLPWLSLGVALSTVKVWQNLQLAHAKRQFMQKIVGQKRLF